MSHPSSSTAAISRPGGWSRERLEEWFQRERDRIISRLVSLINIDTTSPHESACYGLLTDYAAECGATVWRSAVPDGLDSHPLRARLDGARGDYSPKLFHAEVDVAGTQERILFNAHVDVVPPGADFPEAFDARLREGRVYGRGACDTKNNIVMLFEAIRFARDELGGLSKSVIVDLAFEEEVGGAGALATVLAGIQADMAICLEPTSLSMYRGHRGCLGMEIVIKGQPSHMGCDSGGAGAIRGAMAVIEALGDLEIRWLEEAAREADFACWRRPLRINIGYIRGGEWHGSIPADCRIGCNVGFLPPRTLEQVTATIGQITQAALARVETGLSFELRANGIRNEAYCLPEGSRPEIALRASLEVMGLHQEKTYAWNASCDARLYALHAGIPTIVFGSGNLADAHSNHEHIELNELKTGIGVLAHFLSV